jgi:serine/threonine-protein kinase
MIRDLPNFRILEKLGEGGMGAVYRALDLQLDREVALKSLMPQLSRRPDIVERFREEAKIQGRLESPHIVHLYQFLREGNDFFIVMEYVKGSSLHRILSQSKQLPPDHAVSIMIQALEGLDYAHKRNVIHRDVKPANIMINQDGVVKVTDFGIARVIGSARVTKAGNVIGTLEYSSPEAVQGREAMAASDIYSSGVVLYETLAGCLPFTSDNEYDLARMHLESEPPAMRRWTAEVPKALENAVRRALEKRPQDRFATAAEFAAALSASLPAAAGVPVRQESGFWGRLRTFRFSRAPAAAGPAPGGAPPAPAPQYEPGVETRRRAAVSTLSRRVDELLGQKKWEQAEREVNQSLAQAPEDPVLVELHNRVLREWRYYREGIQMAVRGVRSLLDRGLPEPAVSALEASLLRYPEEPELQELLRRAEADVVAMSARSSAVREIAAQVAELQKQARHQDAIALIIETVARLPDHPELTALLSRTVQAQKEHEKWTAVQACAQAVSELQRAAEWAKAFDAIDRLLAQYREEPSLIELRRNVEAERAARQRAEEIEIALLQSSEFARDAQLDSAERVLLDALARYSADSLLSSRLAAVRADKEAARCRALADEAIEKARGLGAERQWKVALDVLETAAREAPRETRLAAVRAEIDGARERYESEVRDAAEKGRSLIASGSLEEAFVELSAASQRFPRERGLAELLLDAQQKLAAERRDRQLREVLAVAGQLLDRAAFAEAEQLLLNAITQFSNEPRLTSVLSAAIEGRREREKRRAIGECLQTVGGLVDEGRLEDAIRELDRALSAYPAEPDLQQRQQEISRRLAEERRARRLEELRVLCGAEVREGRFDSARDRIAAALLEYPGDADFLRLQTSVQEARREAERKRAETDSTARAADLEASGKHEEAIEILRSACDLFPESIPLKKRFDEHAWRWQEISRRRRREAAEAAARSLLQSGDPASAQKALEPALADFPADPELLASRDAISAALRELETKDALRRAEEAIAARRWSSAESILAELDRKWGPGDPGPRKRIATARRARKRALDRALARASSRLDVGDFAGALGHIEPLGLDESECAAFAPLIEASRAGLWKAERERRLAGLLDRVSGLLDRGEVVLAGAAFSAARDEFAGELLFQELGARLRREQGIAAALGGASDHRSAYAWGEALQGLDAAILEFGEDPRLTELAASIRAEQQNRGVLEAMLASAQSLFSAGEYDKAVERLERVIRETTNEPSLQPSLAEARRLLPAYRHAKKLQDVDTTARALIASGHLDEAQAFLLNALPELPGESSVMALLESVREAKRRNRAIDACAETVRLHLQEGNAPRAESALREGLRQYPESGVLKELEAVIDDARHRQWRDRAIEAAVSAAGRLRTVNRFEEARRALANALLEHGADPRFDELAREIDESERRRKTVLQAAASAQERMDRGDFPSAAETIEALPAWVRDDAAVARLLLECQKKIAARARELESVSSRSELFIQTKRFEEAIVAMEEFFRAFGAEARLEPLLGRAHEGREVVLLSAEARRLLSTSGPLAALQFLERTGAPYPDNADLRIVVERLRGELREKERQQGIEQSRSRIDEAIRREEWETAARECEDALGKFPGEQALLGVPARIEQARRTAALRSLSAHIRASLEAWDLEEAERRLNSSRDEFSGEAAWQQLLAAFERRRKYRIGMALAKDARSAGDYAAAEEILRPLLADAPDDDAGLLLNAVQAQRRAVEECARQRAIADGRAEAAGLAQAGDYSGALAILDRLESQYPDETEIRRDREDFRQQLQRQRREAEEEALRERERAEIANARSEAARLLNSGDPQRAWAVLDRLGQRYPDSPEIARDRDSVARELERQRRDAEERAKRALTAYFIRQRVEDVERPVPTEQRDGRLLDAEQRARQALDAYSARKRAGLTRVEFGARSVSERRAGDRSGYTAADLPGGPSSDDPQRAEPPAETASAGWLRGIETLRSEALQAVARGRGAAARLVARMTRQPRR